MTKTQSTASFLLNGDEVRVRTSAPYRSLKNAVTKALEAGADVRIIVSNGRSIEICRPGKTHRLGWSLMADAPQHFIATGLSLEAVVGLFSALVVVQSGIKRSIYDDDIFLAEAIIEKISK